MLDHEILEISEISPIACVYSKTRRNMRTRNAHYGKFVEAA